MYWFPLIVLIVYIAVMTVLYRRKSRKLEQYLILTFADLIIFYGKQSIQVKQFKEKHAGTELLRKCDALALELQPSNKPYTQPED